LWDPVAGGPVCPEKYCEVNQNMGKKNKTHVRLHVWLHLWLLSQSLLPQPVSLPF
jgi:hypothetical protein